MFLAIVMVESSATITPEITENDLMEPFFPMTMPGTTHTDGNTAGPESMTSSEETAPLEVEKEKKLHKQ